MDVRSILIGSLNRAGTGAAAWKNVQLVQSFRLEDLMLEIKYPVEPPPQLASLAEWDGNWQFEADFKAGRLPTREQLRHDYRNGRSRRFRWRRRSGRVGRLESLLRSGVCGFRPRTRNSFRRASR